MKKKPLRLLSLCLCLILATAVFLGHPCMAKGAVKKPAIAANAAYLWDITDNEVLFEKAADTHYANASTTKMLTAILALEHLKPNTVVQFSAEAASRIPTKLWANAGETFYMQDLLYSLLVPSHNDTAVALAEAVSGSEAAFAKLMNKKAVSLGCTHTSFVTASGLDVEGKDHGSSARDLALILRHGMQKALFLDAIRTSSKTIQSLNLGRTFQLATTSPEFRQMAGAIGGKTGYTRKAGYCFAGCFERSGHKFIVVTLGSASSAARWQDIAALMQYAEKYRTENPTTSVTVRWNPVANAQGYTIWYRLNGSAKYIRAGVTTKTSYTQYGLKPGVTYRFAVKPWVKENGTYIFGPVCNKTDGVTKPQPAQISSVTVNANGDVKVKLAKKALGAQKYAMCYSTSPDFRNWNFKIGIRTTYTTRTMAKGLKPGVYYARVRSYLEMKDKTKVYASWSPAVKFTVK